MTERVSASHCDVSGYAIHFRIRIGCRRPPLADAIPPQDDPDSAPLDSDDSHGDSLPPEGRIELLDIREEMQQSYLTYAMSVIVSRALPDVRDGLKPAQRRILVAMNDLSLGPASGRVKCAKISGDTSGNYHPHGESVIYPTLVRMAQDWVMRQTLIDKQGNFGSIAGLGPAAMRYTEAQAVAGRFGDAGGPGSRHRRLHADVRPAEPGTGRPSFAVSRICW